GHSYFATVRSALAAGWAPFPGGEVDALRARMADTVAPLDHQLLNDHLSEPTDENLARWVRAHLVADVPGIVQVGVQST
ncbi:6-carboxytetrahydropterin synthase, partial [Klebsiella pneumoniae]|uniref:6-carboxytetrahydropterin synthase n=1 Tax=Klebsiella pneumoniae TaxID=573 RepID=UPI002731AA5C